MQDEQAPGCLGAWTITHLDFYAPRLLDTRGEKIEFFFKSIFSKKMVKKNFFFSEDSFLFQKKTVFYLFFQKLFFLNKSFFRKNVF